MGMNGQGLGPGGIGETTADIAALQAEDLALWAYIDELENTAIPAYLQNKLNVPTYRRWGAWITQGTTTTYLAVASNLAIAVVAATTTVVANAFGNFINRVTSTVAANVARVNHAAAEAVIVQPRWEPVLEFDVMTDASAITGLMYYFGWWAGNVPPVNGTGVAGSYLGFRYLAGTDSGWVGLINNGQIANQTVVALTGASIAADTRYRLRIEVNTQGTSANFYINGVLVGTTSSANLPAASTAMGIWAQVVNLPGGVGSARSFSMASAYWEWGL